MVSRFRVKKLSPKHPLPIYKEHELPDLADATNIQRAVPQIETGVEKEEEEEHDLQAAISAAQAAVTTGVSIEKYIPTPDASRSISNDKYSTLYKRSFKEPSTLIKFSSTVEDCIGCPYVMDEEDDGFLQSYNKQSGESLSEDAFENIMNECEMLTNQNWPHLYLDPDQTPDLNTFKEHVPEHSKLSQCTSLPAVYEHWRNRRLKRKGKSIIAQLKLEETIKNELDPYICFRRRETKPVRKTRRTDQQSLERLRKLRSEMEMARNLLEMVLRREKIRKEGLMLEHTVFDKKMVLQDFQRVLGIKEDEDLIHMTKKKRKISVGGSSGATIKIPLHKLRRDIRIEKTPAQLAIEAELLRKKEADMPYEDMTESPYQPFPLATQRQFFQPLSNSRMHYRKRVGRGGRIFLDRSSRFRPTSVSGKTKPGMEHDRIFNRYQFDSDHSDNDDDEDSKDSMELDEMDSLYLKHRVQLLSETELRNLMTVPFLTPLNMINQARAAAAVAGQQQQQSQPSPQPVSAQPPNRSPSSTPTFVQQTVSPASPIKRQASRTKLTPQQAAVAMANGMIAANMAAVVNVSYRHLK
ncbi:unnamed protein product [Rhizopus stolonifer]